MRKLIIIAACAFAAVSAFGASKAATEAWVTNKIANTAAEYITHAQTSWTNGVTYIQIAGGVMTIEDSSVYALCAENATAAAVAQGVTNGMYFVWDGASHAYTNYTQTIEATKTNFVWRGYQSVGSNFSNQFSVVGRKLQPSVAMEVVK